MERTPADDEPQKVLRRTFITMAAGGALAVAGCQTIDSGDKDEDEEDADTEADASIVFPEQTTDGSSIHVESVSLPTDGFISIQDPTLASRNWEDQRETDFFDLTVLGSSDYLEKGTHENFDIELDDPLEVSRQYMVMAHSDTTDDESFTYTDSRGEEDAGFADDVHPYNVAVGDAFLTIEEDQEGIEVTEEDPEAEGGENEEEIDEEEQLPSPTIELEGYVGGWQGIAPGAIEGETNPTLEIVPGEEYDVVWENGDGVGHNFAIEDENGEAIQSSEIISGEGDTQTVSFTAEGDFDEYVCQPHPESMRGDFSIADPADPDTEDDK